MKKLVVLTLFLMSFNIFAKETVDFSKFNQHLTKNMDGVLKDNPELYEKKQGRFPASVGNSKHIVNERLDQVEEQAVGQKSW